MLDVKLLVLLEPYLKLLVIQRYFNINKNSSSRTILHMMIKTNSFFRDYEH